MIQLTALLHNTFYGWKLSLPGKRKLEKSLENLKENLDKFKGNLKKS